MKEASDQEYVRSSGTNCRSKLGRKFRQKKERYLCMSNIKIEAIHLTTNSLKKHALSLSEIRCSILNMM